MALLLRLEFLSDAAPGSGTDDAGLVDRDVTTSSAGLPIIPARRLKGCLRESALDVVEALGVADKGVVVPQRDIDRLFGESGGAEPGLLRIQDARLAEADALEKMLAWAAAQSIVFDSAAVRAVYTYTRSQTALDPRTGGARTNTLRTTRVIIRDSVLFAPVRFYSDNEDVRHLFGLACAAFRSFGLARNRGMGEVRARLVDLDNDPTGDTMLSQALTWLQKRIEEAQSNG